MSEVRAAGAVLWRPSPAGGVEVAVVHRPRYDDWSLPKGKLEPGEDPLLGALREVHEETGMTAVAGARAGTTSYEVLVGGQRRPKTVQWWSARATGGAFVPGDEVDALRWCPPAQAEELLTAGRDVAPLRRALALLGSRTVVLVRHARAGDRDAWDGPDADRPLDARGRAQAEALAAPLAAYGPARLVAAPPVRCRDTLGPLARRTGLPVEQEPLLGEDAFAPAASLARLRALVDDVGAAVVCSQGGAVPSLVAAIVDEAGLPPVPTRTRKAAAWVLSLVDGRLVDLDPRPPPG